MINRTFYPTFRRKISHFHNYYCYRFSIWRHFDRDFGHELKMDIGLFKNQKTIAINFQQVPLRFQIILTCFKNAIREKCWFSKKYCGKWVLCLWNGKISRFVALLADIIEAKAIIDRLKHYEYRKYPGVKIARLAVDSKFERRDNGNVKKWNFESSYLLHNQWRNFVYLIGAYPKSHFIINRWEFSKSFSWSWAWLILQNTRPKKQISSFGMSSQSKKDIGTVLIK